MATYFFRMLFLLLGNNYLFSTVIYRNSACALMLVYLPYFCIIISLFLYLFHKEKRLTVSLLPEISRRHVSVSSKKDWNVLLGVCLWVRSLCTEGALYTQTYTHMNISTLFFLQIWGHCKDPIQKVLCTKPQGASRSLSIQRGLCEAPQGLVHTFINTYTYFSFFSYGYESGIVGVGAKFHFSLGIAWNVQIYTKKHVGGVVGKVSKKFFC